MIVLHFRLNGKSCPYAKAVLDEMVKALESWAGSAREKEAYGSYYNAALFPMRAFHCVFMKWSYACILAIRMLFHIIVWLVNE